MKFKKIYILSDSLGDTAEQVVMAAAEQFSSIEYEIKKFSFVNKKDYADSILKKAKEVDALVVFTIVIDEVKNEVLKIIDKYSLEYIDIMTPILSGLEEVFGIKPTCEAGVIRKLDKKYFTKVEAIEFAVKYDDGKNIKGIKKADIVLIGISRTSKTPLSMYLAHKNFKVTNIPLVPEMPVPKEIYEIDKNKIIGLTADPYKLNEIRLERIRTLGLDNTIAEYAKISRILEELKYANKIYEEIGCTVIDVSNKAVEETANIITNIIMKKG